MNINEKYCAIPLVSGKGFAIVDREDYEQLWRRDWYIGGNGYAVTNTPAREFMHKMILPSLTHVDHVNGNKMDNRRHNLHKTV